MVKNYSTKMIKLNAPLAGHEKGSIIPIKVHKDGTPVEKYWRDRKKDSKIDKCIELIKPEKESKKAVKTSKKD